MKPGEKGYCRQGYHDLKDEIILNTDLATPMYGKNWGYCEPWCNPGEDYPSQLMEVQLDALTDEEE